MSRRRTLLGIAAGSSASLPVPTEGLVFHASFASTLTPEIGPAAWTEIRAGAAIAYDELLRRNVCHNVNGCLSATPTAAMPSGNAEFTVGLLLKVNSVRAQSLSGPYFCWGSTPFSNTVAAISWSYEHEDLVHFTTWHRDGLTGSNAAGKWHHWCGVHNASNRVIFYRDGVKVADGEFSFNIGKNKVSVGSFWNSYADNADYGIANIRIYDRVLANDEIKALATEK